MPKRRREGKKIQDMSLTEISAKLFEDAGLTNPLTIAAALGVKPKPKPKVVYTNPPLNCDICGDDFKGTMYDAKTTHGPWGNLCTDCFKKHGVGLGTGRGQKYQQLNEEDGTLDWTPGTPFTKVEG